MIINDKEFGEVIVRKNALSRGVKFSVSTSGRLQMSVPKYTSDFLAKRFLNSNRKVIREKLPLKNPKEQRARDYQKKILMKKAREYLPYRLEYYANLYGYFLFPHQFTYTRERRLYSKRNQNLSFRLEIGCILLCNSIVPQAI